MSGMIPAWLDGRLQPVEKLRVHREGLRHKAVSVFVTHGPLVLLQQRAAGKYHTPGLWANACCTHPAWDEDAATCAHRRLAEELGVDDLPLTHRDRVEYRADVGGGLIEHELVDIFAAEAPAEMPLSPDPEEVGATAWMDRTALTADVAARPALYTPWLRIYLERHAVAIFGAAA